MTQPISSNHRWTLVVCLRLAAGCRKPVVAHPPRFPVKGTVTYNGVAPAGALVTFWSVPVDVDNWRAVKPMAVVAADGSFSPNSYAANDGAIPGDYVLTITWSPSPATPDLFDGRYSSPENAIAKVTIRNEPNNLPPIELKGPPVSASNSQTPTKSDKE